MKKTYKLIERKKENRQNCKKKILYENNLIKDGQIVHLRRFPLKRLIMDVLAIYLIFFEGGEVKIK